MNHKKLEEVLHRLNAKINGGHLKERYIVKKLIKEALSENTCCNNPSFGVADFWDAVESRTVSRSVCNNCGTLDPMGVSS